MLDVLLLVSDGDNQFHSLSRLIIFVVDHFHLVIPKTREVGQERKSIDHSHSNLFILTLLLTGDNRSNEIIVLNNQVNPIEKHAYSINEPLRLDMDLNRLPNSSIHWPKDQEEESHFITMVFFSSLTSAVEVFFLVDFSCNCCNRSFCCFCKAENCSRTVSPLLIFVFCI